MDKSKTRVLGDPVVRQLPVVSPESFLREYESSRPCAETDPEIFFSERNTKFERMAKEICSYCVVNTSCRPYSLSPEAHAFFPLKGIWGGLNEKERNGILRKQKLSEIDAAAS